MRNVFTSFLSLFASVVHVAMVILRMPFIHVQIDIHGKGMRLNSQMFISVIVYNAACAPRWNLQHLGEAKG